MLTADIFIPFAFLGSTYIRRIKRPHLIDVPVQVVLPLELGSKAGSDVPVPQVVLPLEFGSKAGMTSSFNNANCSLASVPGTLITP